MSDPHNMPTPSEVPSSTLNSREGEKDRVVDASLARSVLYGTLAVGFRPPSSKYRERLLSAEGRSVIRRAGEFLCSRAEGTNLVAATDRLTVPDAEEPEVLRVRYQRIFGHTARGLVCPFETEYGVQGLFRQPQELADISGYYLAFGLRPRTGAGERGDHVACECEFLDFLNRKEAVAAEKGDLPMAEETAKAIRGFLRDHLGRFGRAFAGRLLKADPDGYYGALAALLHELLVLEAGRLDLPLGREVLELRSSAPDQVPMACGRPEPSGEGSSAAGCEGCPE